MKKNLRQEELDNLHRIIRNALSEAIGVMEREGAKMLDIKKHGDVGWLTKMRMDVLHQKNNLKNVLIISDKETEKNIYKSVRNIPDVKLINDEGTNVYDLIKFKNVLFTTSSIKSIEQRLTNEKN